MKTPREILLEQHRSATPKLDAIRREIVTKAQGRAINFAASLFGGSNTLWRELIFPCRRIWTGLAAAWVLIFIVNFSQRDNVSSVTGKTVHSGEMIMSWQAQQHWMNELFADRSASTDADRPRNFTPKPRTENFAPATV